MRLAVISDIHGNLLALEAVLADIATRGVDATINLGDCVAGPLWPRETFERLQALALPTVRGNHDRWIIDRLEAQMPPAGLYARHALSPAQREALHALPATVQFSPEILAVHGTPGDDMAYLLEEPLEDGRLAPARRALLAERLGATDSPVLLCGHSHRQAVVTGPGAGLIVNPGSVGCPAFADSPVAATLEHRSPHARYAVLTKRGAGWSTELFALDYDWDAAARQAAALGFPKWATMLATGCVE
jgi:putative phosphoesterase